MACSRANPVAGLPFQSLKELLQEPGDTLYNYLCIEHAPLVDVLYCGGPMRLRGRSNP